MVPPLSGGVPRGLAAWVVRLRRVRAGHVVQLQLSQEGAEDRAVLPELRQDRRDDRLSLAAHVQHGRETHLSLKALDDVDLSARILEQPTFVGAQLIFRCNVVPELTRLFAQVGGRVRGHLPSSGSGAGRLRGTTPRYRPYTIPKTAAAIRAEFVM